MRGGEVALGIGGGLEGGQADAPHRLDESLAGLALGTVGVDHGLDHVGHFLGGE
jgi:hypothetical protein